MDCGSLCTTVGQNLSRINDDTQTEGYLSQVWLSKSKLSFPRPSSYADVISRQSFDYRGPGVRAVSQAMSLVSERAENHGFVTRFLKGELSFHCCETVLKRREWNFRITP